MVHLTDCLNVPDFGLPSCFHFHFHARTLWDGQTWQQGWLMASKRKTQMHMEHLPKHWRQKLGLEHIHD